MIINSNTLVYEHPQDDPIENVQGSTCVEIRGLEPGYLYYAKTTITNDMNLSATSSLYSFYTLPDSYVIAEVIDHETIKCIIEVMSTHVDTTTVGLMYKKASEPDWLEVTSEQQVIMLENLEPTTVYYLKSFVVDEFGRKSVSPDFIDVITPDAPVTIDVNIHPSPTALDCTINLIADTIISDATYVLKDENNVVVANGNLQLQPTQDLFINNLTPNSAYTLTVSADNGIPSSTTTNFTTLSPVELFTDSEITCNVQTNNGCTTTVSFTPTTLNRNYLLVDSVSIVVATTNGNIIDSYTSSTTQLQYTHSFSLLPDMELGIYGKVYFRIDGDQTNTLYEYTTDVVDVLTYSQLQFIDYQITNNFANVAFDVMGNFQQVFLEYNNNNTWTPIGYNHQNYTCRFPLTQGVNTIRGRVLNAAGLSEYTTLRIVN